MNRALPLLASVLFFIAFAIEVVSIPGSFSYYNESLGGISSLLFSTYVVPFELVSLILVGGIIGMLYITGREE
ncbi:MAG: hypothetical protein M1267_03975 [Candidatus Thermoplasmatota archaeon]|jgi:NADH-quinone oxidoreductase subunit J|nr:hypothetical protein [Candidatus Thermoplasmatota archaeon]MCL5800625.1 hypothetical protein [Candidatus Thermoplasmatota archaeon]